MKIIALAICLFMLSGCAALRDRIASMNNPNPKEGSATFILRGIAESDSTQISQDIAQFLANQYPAAKTTIELDAVKSVLHAKLREQLTRRGFGVTEGIMDSGVHVRYSVTPLESGLLVRMRYHKKYASRYYARDIDSRLSLQSRFTLREAAK